MLVKVGTLGPHTVLPIAVSCPIIFSWISLQGAKSGLYGGWVTWVICCFAGNSAWDLMHKQACCHDEAANHLLPTAVAFWIILVVSGEECLSFRYNLMQICCSICSCILNVTATQYTCSLNGVYRPHWLAQWSCHCLRMCIPVHSPWLPGYMDVVQIILVTVTMAGLFPDRPHVFIKNWQILFPQWLYYFSFQTMYKKLLFAPHFANIWWCQLLKDKMRDIKFFKSLSKYTSIPIKKRQIKSA